MSRLLPCRQRIIAKLHQLRPVRAAWRLWRNYPICVLCPEMQNALARALLRDGTQTYQNWTATMTILHQDGTAVKPFDVQLTSRYPHITGQPITVGNKVSGFLMAARREYYRRVEGSRHFLKKPAGIANDLAALAEAERLGADRCRILDSETGIEYLCALPIIYEFGTHIDRGFGQQIALPFAYWIRTAPDGTITKPTLPKQQPAAQQPALFRFDEPVTRKMGAY